MFGNPNETLFLVFEIYYIKYVVYTRVFFYHKNGPLFFSFC